MHDDLVYESGEAGWTAGLQPHLHYCLLAC